MKEFTKADLYIGMLLTGNKFCFRGRIEILQINENKILVSLSNLNIDLTTSIWIEEWDLHIVTSALTIGEYIVCNKFSELMPPPCTTVGCFNQIVNDMENVFNSTNNEKTPISFSFCSSNNDFLLVMISNTNFYSKEFNILRPVLVEFFDNYLYQKYELHSLVSNGMILITKNKIKRYGNNNRG